MSEWCWCDLFLCFVVVCLWSGLCIINRRVPPSLYFMYVVSCSLYQQSTEGCIFLYFLVPGFTTLFSFLVCCKIASRARRCSCFCYWVLAIIVIFPYYTMMMMSFLANPRCSVVFDCRFVCLSYACLFLFCYYSWRHSSWFVRFIFGFLWAFTTSLSSSVGAVMKWFFFSRRCHLSLLIPFLSSYPLFRLISLAIIPLWQQQNEITHLYTQNPVHPIYYLYY